MKNEMIHTVKSICPAKTDVSMKTLTTFRIGGVADIVAMPENESQLSALLKTKIPFLLIGNGSNLLCGDNGFRGMVIKIGPSMQDIKIDGDIIYVKAGTTLAAAAHAALEAGLGGMEFAAGIPGTVGGAVLMNAGAYGGEMADIVVETQYLTMDGERHICHDHDFSYRHSMFQTGDKIITSTVLKLYREKRAVILEKMETLAKKRREKQPLDKPSAGSTFKRPKEGYAAQMIDEAGLRGYRIGDAAVSEKHAGFVVNLGAASAKDVRLLMEHIQNTVLKTHGVLLEPEIRFVGEFL